MKATTPGATIVEDRLSPGSSPPAVVSVVGPSGRLDGWPDVTDRSAPVANGPLPRHLLPDNASVDPNGRLSIGGVDILDLVADVGTPVFVFDEEHLRSRCRQARDAFGPGTAYASKAFLCRAMARLVCEEGLAIDVATGGELHVALRAGVPAHRVVLHGSNKSDEELVVALRRGVGRIVVDSWDEIGRLERLTPRWARSRPRVLVRVTPGIPVDTHPAVATGQTDSKFGFNLSAGEADAAVRRLRHADSPVELVGIHAHIGSQVFDLSSLEDAIGVLAEFFLPLDLDELCVGGGLGVGYDGDRRAPTIGEWAAAVRRACRRSGIPDEVRVTAEPGRAIAATAAITCYRVGTMKAVPGGRLYVSVDGGMSDNPRPALYGSRYEAFLPRRTAAPRPRAATIVGKHCESGDVLVADGHLPDDVAVGDILTTPVTGAYGYAMASNYNRVPRPPVVFVHNGRYRTVLRRETLRDLLRLDA